MPTANLGPQILTPGSQMDQRQSLWDALSRVIQEAQETQWPLSFKLMAAGSIP